ncbi:hypothetical protein J437_LFUL004248 [Ladona fulva]|uniref:Homeobox domain-containing protein n=1 Tax=Ladona fulva TaxID=123851 RepID=A0A8K0NXK5_LADFU|nr:hypothetical protein J437_LFUL004248 [Ladona fulva]
MSSRNLLKMSYYFSPSSHVKSVSPQLSPGSTSTGSFSPAPAAFLPPAPFITDVQREALEAQFARLKNPHSTDVMLLAAETGLHENEVQLQGRIDSPPVAGALNLRKPGSPADWLNGGETRGWLELVGVFAKGSLKRGGGVKGRAGPKPGLQAAEIPKLLVTSSSLSPVEKSNFERTGAATSARRQFGAATASVVPSAADRPYCSEDRELGLEDHVIKGRRFKDFLLWMKLNCFSFNSSASALGFRVFSSQ